MDLECEKARKAVLELFDHVMTCGLAKQLCIVMGRNLAVLSTEDVQSRCELISKLCGQHGCKKQSNLCLKASQAAEKNEEQFKKLCEESRKHCGQESSQKTQNYVA